MLRGRYLAKFWCTLAWIEQYWNDAKGWNRKRGDFTLPKLKANFPVALDTACPITQIRKFMQRSLDHVRALREIGRYGDFGRIDGPHKQCKRSARSPPRRLHCWPDTSHSLVPLRNPQPQEGPPHQDEPRKRPTGAQSEQLRDAAQGSMHRPLRGRLPRG